MKGKILLTIPKSCRDCKFFLQEYGYSCLAEDECIEDHVEWLKHHYAAERPAWCPICEDRLMIPLGEHKITAEIYDCDGPEFPPEITVHLRDSEDIIIQDFALVRPHYKIVDGAVKISDNTTEILVWGDPDNEDYTNEYYVKTYEVEE